MALHEIAGRRWPVSKLTIDADDIYATEADVRLAKQIGGWLEAIQKINIPQRGNIVLRELHDSMTRAIFGSNQIERAGLNWELTTYLCQKVLAGDNSSEISLPTREFLFEKQADLKSVSGADLTKRCNEVTQHAKAYQHILHAFVTEETDFSGIEEIVKDTHRILVEGVPLVEEGFDDIKPEDYGGIYRNVIVGAGTTNFTVPKFVPSQMARMCESLEQDLRQAEEKEVVDPFSIACKYSLEFVQIHPFRDGNGRMCRMILNAIVCRYLGVIIPIGEQEDDREAYIAIKRKSSQDMHGHRDYATFVLHKGKTRVRQLKKKLTGKKDGEQDSGI